MERKKYQRLLPFIKEILIKNHDKPLTELCQKYNIDIDGAKNYTRTPRYKNEVKRYKENKRQ